MKAYKGFNKDMTCRGFQYEEGKTYELPEGEEAKLCETGFHACENPVMCLSYYDASKSVYHEVELEDFLQRPKTTLNVLHGKLALKRGWMWQKSVSCRLTMLKNIVPMRTMLRKERRHRQAIRVRHRQAHTVRHRQANPVRHRQANPVRHRQANTVRQSHAAVHHRRNMDFQSQGGMV